MASTSSRGYPFSILSSRLQKHPVPNTQRLAQPLGHGLANGALAGMPVLSESCFCVSPSLALAPRRHTPGNVWSVISGKTSRQGMESGPMALSGLPMISFRLARLDADFELPPGRLGIASQGLQGDVFS